jgi:hypothetical protein
VKLLVRGSTDWRVRSPLIGDNSLAERSADELENVVVKKEHRCETRRRERHRQKMSMRSSIGFVRVSEEMREQQRPEGAPAIPDTRRGQATAKNTVAALLQLLELLRVAGQRSTTG